MCYAISAARFFRDQSGGDVCSCSAGTQLCKRMQSVYSVQAMALALGLFLLSACAGATGIGSDGGTFAPRILSATERSVSVEIMLLHNEGDALAVAQQHCQQYERHAVLVQDRGGGKFNYQCVE